MNAASGDFESEIGYVFRDPGLLGEALTHSSYANESGCSNSNERLEFLGDAVLELCVSEILYLSAPCLSEGGLTRARSNVVREAALASWAEATRLPGLLWLGKGLECQCGRSNPSILADAMEAVLGAIFLDGGYGAVRRVVEKLVGDVERIVANVDDGSDRDAKSLLQEALQAMGDKPPVYRLTGRSGPDHASSFEVEAVFADGSMISVGRGNSIKSAEFAAAQTALCELSRIGKLPEQPGRVGK
ncbi:MAG: ribonuclease III [Synergistaceae bacterium]|jgi:ribonuclease-3|nr:ribonuclease III [Synergistaceae bacterium]